MNKPALNWINRIAFCCGIAVAGWFAFQAFTESDVLASSSALRDEHGHDEHGHDEHGGEETGEHAAHEASEASAAVDACCEVPADTGVQNVAKVIDEARVTALGAEAVDDCCAVEAPGNPEAGVATHESHSTDAESNAVDDCCAVGAPGAVAEIDASVHEGPWCGEHNVAEAQCAICQPQLTAALKPGESLLLRMTSSESARKSGVQLGLAREGNVASDTTFLGEVSYNQTRKAHITPRVSGRVEAVFAVVGDIVEGGAPLVRLSSPEIASAKERLLTAVAEARIAGKRLASEEAMWEAAATSRQAVDEARAEQQKISHRVAAARQELLNMGLSEGEVKVVLDQSDTSAEVTVLAPFEGTLVEQHAVTGERADPGTEMFTLVDLSEVWLQMAIPVQRAGSLRSGDPVEAHFEGLGERIYSTTVDWISPQVDSATRTVSARAVLENADGALRAGLYGKVRLVEDGVGPGLRVPSDAVQQYDGRPYVFVQREPDLFEVRQVQLGNTALGEAEVLAGLAPDDAVVTAGSYLVKSEFLKARLGAGCTDH